MPRGKEPGSVNTLPCRWERKSEKKSVERPDVLSLRHEFVRLRTSELKDVPESVHGRQRAHRLPTWLERLVSRESMPHQRCTNCAERRDGGHGCPCPSCTTNVCKILILAKEGRGPRKLGSVNSRSLHVGPSSSKNRGKLEGRPETRGQVRLTHVPLASSNIAPFPMHTISHHQTQP